MTATSVPSQSQKVSSSPGFGGALAAEWTKMRSVRSSWIMVFLAILLSVGFSALMAFVTGITFDDWGANDQATYDPIIYSINGVLFSIIMLIVIGATTATSEYSSRMIRTTFIVNPRRTQVLAAKAVIVGALGIVISAASMLGMFLVGQAIFGSYGLETASLGDSDVMRLIATYAIFGGLIYTLIPLAIGFLLRGTASAITASIGFFFLPFMLGAALPTWVQENVVRFFPDIAMDSLGGMTDSDAAMHSSDGLAVVIILAWLIGSMVIASVILNRRDA